MNDENGHPALFPILGGKQSIQSFTIKYDVSCGFFVNTLTRLRKIFSVPDFLMFLSNMFYTSTEMIMWFLSFVLIFLYYND